MDVRNAANLTLGLFDDLDIAAPTRDPEAKTTGHAYWMLEGIILGYIHGEKAHRWLGYAQALMVSNNIGSLKVMKDINNRA